MSERQNGCKLEHDPAPYLRQGLAMAQVSWWSDVWKWAPRNGYCQRESCPGYVLVRATAEVGP